MTHSSSSLSTPPGIAAAGACTAGASSTGISASASAPSLAPSLATSPAPKVSPLKSCSSNAFVDPASSDYRLTPGSPCVDALDAVRGLDYLDLDQDAVLFEPIPLDLDMTLRVQDGDGDAQALPDMGAYESPTTSTPPPPIPDGTGVGQPMTAERLDASGQAPIRDQGGG